VNAVPEDLIKNALIVGGIKGEVPVQGQKESEHKKCDRCTRHHP
jgi:hypothetical protein